MTWVADERWLVIQRRQVNRKVVAAAGGAAPYCAPRFSSISTTMRSILSSFACRCPQSPHPPMPPKVGGVLLHRQLPHRTRLRSVTELAGPAIDGVERFVERVPVAPCALGALRVGSWAVRAGRASGAPQQSTLNPRVRGSSPWRRTRADLLRRRSRPAKSWNECSFHDRPSYPVVDDALVTQSDWSLAVVQVDSAASWDFGSGEVMRPTAPPAQRHAR